MSEEPKTHANCPCSAQTIYFGKGTCRCGLRWRYDEGIEGWRPYP